MRITISGILAISLFLASAAQARPDLYAALAWSRSMVATGESNNQTSQEDARDEALRNCGYQDCVVMAQTENGCVAYAIGLNDRRWYGFSNGQDRKEAEKLALKICEYDAHDYCQLLDSFCTDAVPPR